MRDAAAAAAELLVIEARPVIRGWAYEEI